MRRVNPSHRTPVNIQVIDMAKKPKTPILVPIDFSPHSTVALLKACEMAKCMEQSITILHVVHDPGEMPGYYSHQDGDENALVRIEDLALDMLETFMQKTIEKHPEIKLLQKAETMLVTGLPVTRILEVAEKIDASMIVMGSQGRTGLKHIMLGSKAEQVVRLSQIPVTIVKAINI